MVREPFPLRKESVPGRAFPGFAPNPTIALQEPAEGVEVESRRDPRALRERDAVLAAAAGLVERVRTGTGGGSLFIVGEAGLGKTVLLEHARRLAGDGFAVGLGQGDPMEASLPFALVAQALAGLGGEEDRGGLAAPVTDERRTARFYEILRWLERVRRPTLVLLDDLHCADPDSLALVSFLSRRFAEGPVALIGTLRPWPMSAADLASMLAHAGHAAIQRLLPLGPDAARGLLAERVEQPVSPEILEQIAELCAGNPLLLEQAALALDRGDDVVTAAASPHRLIDRYQPLTCGDEPSLRAQVAADRATPWGGNARTS